MEIRVIREIRDFAFALQVENDRFLAFSSSQNELYTQVFTPFTKIIIVMKEDVLARMENLIRTWQVNGDRRSVFLRCYQMMTGNMLHALQAGEFTDTAWVSALLHRFAEYYFDALDAYEQRSPATPAVWQTVHEAAQNREMLPLQLLVSGVNAHINYDLVLALVDLLQPEWTGLSPEKRAERHRDHRHVNDIIGATIDTVQDQVLEPLEPGLEVVDVVFGRLDEWLISQLIIHWREEVWENALTLLAAPDVHKREPLRQQIEAATQKKASVILLKTGLSGWKALIRPV